MKFDSLRTVQTCIKSLLYFICPWYWRRQKIPWTASESLCVRALMIQRERRAINQIMNTCIYKFEKPCMPIIGSILFLSYRHKLHTHMRKIPQTSHGKWSLSTHTCRVSFHAKCTGPHRLVGPDWSANAALCQNTCSHWSHRDRMWFISEAPAASTQPFPLDTHWLLRSLGNLISRAAAVFYRLLYCLKKSIHLIPTFSKYRIAS